MKQVLHSLKDGSTQLADVPSPRAASGQLLIRTSATLVSAGTERMLVEFGKANWLDLKILALTGWKSFRREGINQPGQVTAEEFMGSRS